jgi:hypothetical protein
VSAYIVKTVAKEFAGGNISTGSVVVDWANGNAQAFSILSTAAMAAPVNGSAGVTYLLKFQQDGTGSKQMTWNSANFQFAGGITPTLGGASAVDLIGLYYDGTTYYGLHDVRSVTVGGGSVTSTELSAASAAAAANLSVAASALSARIDAVSQARSASDAQLSARGDSVFTAYLAGIGTTQLKVVADVQSVSATALTNISGLTFSLAVNGIYQVEAQLLYRTSTAAGNGWGLSFAGMKAAAGTWQGQESIAGQAPASGNLSGLLRHAIFNEAASNSVVLSMGTTNSGTQRIKMEGLFNVSTAGSAQMLVKTSAAVTAIQPGSFVRVYRIG